MRQYACNKISAGVIFLFVFPQFSWKVRRAHSVYLLIFMSSAEMIVLFLSLRYFVTGEPFRFGIPSRCIFLSGAVFSINSQTGAASTPASYIGSLLLVIIIFSKLSLRIFGV